MPRATRTVQSLHFEDLDGKNFERLVFAYHVRITRWRSIEWYGQTGSDLGRDIICVRDNDFPNGEIICVQCVNRSKFTLAKAKKDINNACEAPSGKPDRFRFVCRTNLSAEFRDSVKAHAKSKQVYECDLWSGEEFEEFLRKNTESLLKRFFEGEEYPDSGSDIKKFVAELPVSSDAEIFALMAGLFDRPAFYTPFRCESSVPAFKQAIADTIEALNTGVHRLRDGTVIRRIPSRHQLKEDGEKKALAEIEHKLTDLRTSFEQFMRSKEIRPCGCDNPNCFMFVISHNAGEVMDRLRTEILDGFRRIYPKFDVRVRR